MRRTSFLLSVFGLILVLSVAPIQAREGSAAPVSDWPEDARSTTGPIPPTGIERGYQAARAPLAQAILNDVPAYLWHHGCGPTAAGMVVGYWDGHGFDDLVSGSAAAQTAAVNAMISSQGNYSDYCLPIDSYPNLLADRSEPPVGDEHPDDCVADLMKTSQSYHHNFYGWSWFSHIDDALLGYVNLVAPHYDVTVDNQLWGTLTWNSYRAEIDARRPVVLLVDTDGNGSTDHFVTGIGYSDEDGTQMYAVHDTWDTNVHWFRFAQMGHGRPWGIYGATLFQISRPIELGYRIFVPLVERAATTSSGFDAQLSGSALGRGTANRLSPPESEEP